MSSVKVSEATNVQLNWLVAVCEGHKVATHNTGEVYLIDTPWANKNTVKWIAAFKPSTAWAQMGPIVERERIDLQAKIRAGSDIDEWRAVKGFGGGFQGVGMGQPHSSQQPAAMW